MNNLYQLTANQSLNDNTQSQAMYQGYQQAGSLVGGANSLEAQGLTTTGIIGNYTYYPYQWPNYQPNYPIQYYITTTAYPGEPTYEIKVEKVANGFIVHKNDQKFVVSKPEDIVKYLKDDNGKSK